MEAVPGADFDDYVVARSAALLRTATLLCGGDIHAAEDLLQQALVRLARHWHRSVEHPDAYMHRVLVNLAHDRRRWFRRRPAEAPLTAVVERAESDPEAAIARDELLAALAALPPRQRATLVLRFWNDLSVHDTAAALKCSIGTVKSNTSRGLARLRQVLEDESLVDRR